MICGPRVHVTDVLRELQEDLMVFMESKKSLAVYLRERKEMRLLTPRRIIELILRHYASGVLYIEDFVPGGCVRGTEHRYRRTKEASSCVTTALHEVYGLPAEKVEEAKSSPLYISRFREETEGEKSVKHELRWVFVAPQIEAELELLGERLTSSLGGEEEFRLLKQFGNFSAGKLEHHLAGIVSIARRGALPSQEVVSRAEKFLHVLNREVEKALAQEKK